MTRSPNIPGLGGYDFDKPAELPVQGDYDLFGMDEPDSVDMLQADRTAEPTLDVRGDGGMEAYHRVIEEGQPWNQPSRSRRVGRLAQQADRGRYHA